MISPLKDALLLMGVELLAAPASSSPNLRETPRFESLETSLAMHRFGAFGALDDLEANWEGLAHPAAAELQELALKSGREILNRYPECYNGTLPRLISWKVSETPTGRSRLSLDLEATTFITWKVTNGNPELPPHLHQALKEGAKGEAVGGHHLPLTVSLVTKDERIVLVQRASGMAVHPDAYGSAANGNVDLASHGEHAGDRDENGEVNLIDAAIREAVEELGGGIDVNSNTLAATALIRYTDTREWGSPVLALEAKSALSVAQVIQGLAYAHPTEGVGELGRHIISIPLHPQDLESVVAFVVGEHSRGALTAPAAVSTLLALAGSCTPELVAKFIKANQEKVSMPKEVLRIPLNIPNAAGHHPASF